MRLADSYSVGREAEAEAILERYQEPAESDQGGEPQPKNTLGDAQVLGIGYWVLAQPAHRPSNGRRRIAS